MDFRAHAVRATVASVVFVALGALAVRVTDEVTDRRHAGFCRRESVIAGATTSEERTWWPLGDRCFVTMEDGTVRTREPGWALTALVPAWLAVVTVGTVAPSPSTRRSLALLVGVPVVVIALAVVVLAHPRSLPRLVGLTTISLGLGAVPAVGTAIVVFWTTRGRPLVLALSTWTGWGVAILLAGRDGVTP